MVVTNYEREGQVIGYEIADDGYDIYLGENKWFTQHEPYIPYRQLGYEGSCLKQIEDLCNTNTTPTSSEEQSNNIEERITALEDMILEMSQVVYAE